MKTRILIFLFVSVISFCEAQPCKTVKIGMTKQEVLKSAGKPDNVVNLGIEKTSKDSLCNWNYGNQQVCFIGKFVHNVVADLKTQNILLLQLQRGEIDGKSLTSKLEEANHAACK